MKDNTYIKLHIDIECISEQIWVVLCPAVAGL